MSTDRRCFDDIPAAYTVAFDEKVRVRLESYRLHRYIEDGSLPHLALGHAADPLIDRFNSLVAAHAEGAPDWFECSGAVEFYARHGELFRLKDAYYFDPPVTLLDPDLRVALRWHGDPRHIEIPVDGPSLALLREILPLCGERRSLGRLRAELRDEDWGILAASREAGALNFSAPSRPRRRGRCRVTLVAHSCLLIETEEARLLVDPVLSVRHRSAIDCSAILQGGVDAVAISHPHWDHFNPDALALIDRSTRLFVPALSRRPSLVNLDLAPLCRELGFDRVGAVAPWERVEIGDIAYTALPYFGEGSGPEGVQDWTTYAIEAGGKLIIGMVDSCHDDFGTMDDVLAEVRRRMGPADLLLSPCSNFCFGLRHFHRRPFTLSGQKEQFTGSAADTVRWAQISGAAMIVPYAEFYFDPDDPENAQPGPGQQGSWRDLGRLMPDDMAQRLRPLRPGDSLSLA